MLAKLRSWWKDKVKPLETTRLIALLLGFFALVIIIGYIFNWDWTGLGPYTPPHPYESNFQRGKTLWDWLQLLVIPVVLAIAGYLFNLTVSRNEQKSTQLRDQNEREIASDNQREEALQQYIDKMSELLLEKKLRESQPEDEVRKIARVRTLTVLPRLDADRKKNALQFLYEAGLIEKDKHIIDLSGANLSSANLSSTFLHNVNLSDTDLSNANLSSAFLADSDLHHTNMSNANLSHTTIDDTNLNNANLSNANLSRATLSRSNLSSADLSLADLSNTFMTGANLSNAFMVGANLSNAELNNANLTTVNLALATLDNTNLSNANLSHLAIIHNIELNDTKVQGVGLGSLMIKGVVTPEQLSKAKSIQGATMPDGSKHP